MAPQIEAAYERIEALIGSDFCERFYRTLDELIQTLQLHTPATVADE